MLGDVRGQHDEYGRSAKKDEYQRDMMRYLLYTGTMPKFEGIDYSGIVNDAFSSTQWFQYIVAAVYSVHEWMSLIASSLIRGMRYS